MRTCAVVAALFVTSAAQAQAGTASITFNPGEHRIVIPAA